ncbi:MAG: ABC transporter, partial [Humibacillus sp.]
MDGTPDTVSDLTASGRLRAGPRRPLSAPERVGAVMGHHLLVYRRTWRGSIIGRFLSPLFFLLAMGVGLGSLVDDRAGGVGGVSYLQFIVPGIIAMQAM